MENVGFNSNVLNQYLTSTVQQQNNNNVNAKTFENDESDSFQLVEKTKFGESFGSGIVNTFKLSIPFYNLYTIGKEHLEQKEAAETLEKLKNGEEVGETKKPGVLKSTWEGIKRTIGAAIPIYGSYMIGKEAIEQDNIIKELNGEEPEKAGFFKCLGKGIVNKIKWAIPFLGTYSLGQEFKEQDKMLEGIEKAKNA